MVAFRVVEQGWQALELGASRGTVRAAGRMAEILRSGPTDCPRGLLRPTATAEPEIIVATIMRKAGGSGVQSHVETFRAYVGTTPRAATLVTPFSARSPFLAPVFGARHAIRPVSRAAGVWWYRHWHAHYLGRALSTRLARTTGPVVVYAQCPVSADVALRVRTTQPVVMAVHFNVSQAEEWADKGEIPHGGRLFASIRSFEDDVLPRLDGLVYVSNFTRSLLQERLPALRTIPGAVIPNCIDVAPPPTVAPMGDLVTVGALEPHKNQQYLLDVLAVAAARGHRYTLTVVGDGPDRGRLEARATQLGLDDLVNFVGYQSDPRPIVAAHRLYCHSSRIESFGIALVEAMAEGLPVLAAPVGGIPEIVRPGIEGDTWPLDDPYAGADRLVAIMTDSTRRVAMAAAAQTRAATEFSSAVQGPRLLDFLSSLGRSR